ncbi:MAG: MerR family transcriptional regulator [Bacteroides sp.]|nr:MerR family transcriptional regulator [Bacteroides sp.]MBD5375805.1 MerR family transcriptional regulator [Bacteroides sp.]
MQELNKKFYKISEVAELLDIPATTLRFWEDRFTVISPRRNAKGIRFYTPEDIDKISMIHYLVKQRGLKLDAAQEQIRRNPTGVSRQHAAVMRLQSIKSRLQEMIKALDSLR